MGAPHQSSANQFANRILHSQLPLDIESRRQTSLASMTDFEKAASAKFVANVAHQKDYVSLRFEELRVDVLFLVDQPDHRHGRRGIDHPCRALIIERDIAAHDRGAESTAVFSG